MKKIPARILSLLTFRRCSVPNCQHAAAVQISFSQYLCADHMGKIAQGRLALEKEKERRRQQRPDFIELVEDDETIRKVERLGIENYDPETDQPRDAGRFMHQRKKEK